MTETSTQTRQQPPDWLNLTAIFPAELIATLDQLNAEATDIAARLPKVCVEGHNAVAAVEQLAHSNPGWCLWSDDTYQLLLNLSGAEKLWNTMQDVVCDAYAITNSPASPPEWLHDRGTPWRRGADED